MKGLHTGGPVTVGTEGVTAFSDIQERITISWGRYHYVYFRDKILKSIEGKGFFPKPSRNESR